MPREMKPVGDDQSPSRGTLLDKCREREATIPQFPSLVQLARDPSQIRFVQHSTERARHIYTRLKKKNSGWKMTLCLEYFKRTMVVVAVVSRFVFHIMTIIMSRYRQSTAGWRTPSCCVSWLTHAGPCTFVFLTPNKKKTCSEWEWAGEIQLI